MKLFFFLNQTFTFRHSLIQMSKVKSRQYKKKIFFHYLSEKREVFEYFSY